MSIVERVENQLGYHCGYCGNDDTAMAQGLWAHNLTALDYQTLIDRGWRRSGKYCYKPMMDKTCCPQNTIKCRALQYKLTKSKKKVLSKMRQFLMTEGDEEIKQWRDKHTYNNTNTKKKPTENRSLVTGQSSGTIVAYATDDMETDQDVELGTSTDMELGPSTSKSNEAVSKSNGADPTKPPCKKAKVLRQEKRLKKYSRCASGDIEPPMNKKNEPKSLREQLPHINPNPEFKKKLVVQIVHANVQNEEFKRTAKESHRVYQKYQKTIHKDDESDCTEKQWQRFLVDCPIQRDQSGPGPGYGNYHQQYILDGKIIAVGVLDILPNCISSVYLYYDPDYGFLSLGAYTALSEIYYTQTLHEASSLLQYYYMGFYIHSCPKMNYKKEYPPSELLCPETYTWVPVPLCLPELDKTKYCRLNVLNGGSPTEVPDKGEGFDINELGVLYRREAMKYHRYVREKYDHVKFPGQLVHGDTNTGYAERQNIAMRIELAELKEYVAIVGSVCAKRMLLCRSYL